MIDWQTETGSRLWGVIFFGSLKNLLAFQVDGSKFGLFYFIIFLLFLYLSFFLLIVLFNFVQNEPLYLLKLFLRRPHVVTRAVIIRTAFAFLELLESLCFSLLKKLGRVVRELRNNFFEIGIDFLTMNSSLLKFFSAFGLVFPSVFQFSRNSGSVVPFEVVYVFLAFLLLVVILSIIFLLFFLDGLDCILEDFQILLDFAF